MSYRCELSGKLIPDGTPAHRLVWAVRPTTYPPRENAFKRRPGGGKRRKAMHDRGGSGLQIAKEYRVCAEVAAKYAGREPDMLPALPPRKRRLEQIEDQLYGDPLKTSHVPSPRPAARSA